MQGQRLRYGGAIFVMLIATLLSYGIPLVSRTTIDYVIAGMPLHAPDFLVRLIEHLGGRSVLGRNLWLATLCIIGFSASAGFFNYLRGRRGHRPPDARPPLRSPAAPALSLPR